MINAFHWCYRSITREEQSEENYEAIRRGGFKRSFIKYWLRDGWIIEGKIERRNGKKPKVADEWEAWYD